MLQRWKPLTMTPTLPSWGISLRTCLTVRTQTIGAVDAIGPGLNGVEKCERCRAAKQKVYQLFVINSSATSFIGVRPAPVAQS